MWFGVTPDLPTPLDTRIRRDNLRDARAVALLYADEDSDRGFLARQVVRLIDDFCVCAETSTRNCPVHQS